MLLRISPTIVTVKRQDFHLSIWKMRGNLYHVEKYLVSVGAIGHTTPSGMYFVVNKTRKPDWNNPATPEFDPIPYDRPWTGDPENPGNPFDGGFISLGGNPKKAATGIGIHGVKFPPMLGRRASHGCIRMDTQEFLQIYDKIPKGTPVYID